jgi:hypothetical protein
VGLDLGYVGRNPAENIGRINAAEAYKPWPLEARPDGRRLRRGQARALAPYSHRRRSVGRPTFPRADFRAMFFSLLA